MRKLSREKNINCGLLLIDKQFENNSVSNQSLDEAEQIAFEIMKNGKQMSQNENVLVQIEEEN